MPTREEIESMRERLNSLPMEERDRLMDELDWEGFTEAEKLDVERRVIEGESSDFWMDGITPESPENHRGKKTYRVYHDTGWPTAWFEQQLMDVDPRRFPEDFQHVANVQANGLREALDLTRDIGGIVDDTRTWEPWERNGKAEALVDAPRDTVPGDVIVDPEGKAYRFERGGNFLDLEFFVEQPYDQLRRQVAEQAQYQARETELER